MKLLLTAFFLSAFSCDAAAPRLPIANKEMNDFAIAPQGETEKPVLSATGKRRLQENLRTLDNNLKDLRENLSSADKNLATIRAELKDLASLEAEHLELKKRYQNYLAKSEGEIAKNEKAKRDLANWEKTSQNTPKDDPNVNGLKDKLEAARKEQAERERWKYDAESKSARVKSLLSGLETNLRDILSRRKPLEQQLETWTTRRAEYVKTIAETETRKAQWESVLTR